MYRAMHMGKFMTQTIWFQKNVGCVLDSLLPILIQALAIQSIETL